MRWSTYVAGLLVLVSSVASANADDIEDCEFGSADLRIQACTRVIENPTNEKYRISEGLISSLYYNRGVGWHAKQRYGKAIADYSAALKLSPEYYIALNDRGYAYLHSGAIKKALTDFRRLVELVPDSVDYTHSLGDGYFHAGDLDEANRTWLEACRLASGQDIRQWQDQLKRQGHYKGKLDGTCSPNVLSAFGSCAKSKCSLVLFAQ